MRKWKFLTAALLLAAGAVSVTSCIDEDEPSGIHEMRTAKAEYYSALAAVQQAEAQYKAALAEHELQNAENQKLINEAKKLKNDLLAAQNEKEKAKLTAKIAEIQAQHEVNMQNIAKTKAEADKAYELALKDLEITVSQLNDQYTAEFQRIVDSITMNRYHYNLKVAELLQKNLELMELTTGRLDTVAERARLNLKIAQAESKVNYLQKQEEALKTVTGAAETNLDQKIAALDKQIREEVNTYNAVVDQYNELNTQYQKEERAYNQQKAADDKVNQDAYNTVETYTLTVAPEIQNVFVTALGLKSDVQILTKTVNGTSVYSLKNGSYTYTERPDVENPASSYTTATFVQMQTELKSDESIVKERLKGAFQEVLNLAGDAGVFSGDFDQQQYDKAMTSLVDHQNVLAKLKAVYDADRQAWETAKNSYVAARQAYMYNGNMDYFEYVKGVVDALANNPAPTATDTATVVAALKDYGAKREALDGWVAATVSGTTFTKDYETLTAANYTGAKATIILGNATLNATGKDATTKVDYATKPYGAYIKASAEAFGTNPVIGSAAFTAPDEAEEILVPSQQVWGGSFAKYLDEYKNVNTFLKAQGWKAIADALENAIRTYNDRQEAAKATEKAQKDAQKALQEVAMAVKIQRNMVGKDVITGAGDPQLTRLDVKYKTSDNRSIEIIKGTPTIGGNLGGYIMALVTLHNGLISGITDYEKEFARLTDQRIDAEEALAGAKQDLSMFENGGYVISEKEGYLKVRIEEIQAEISKLESEIENLNAELENI